MSSLVNVVCCQVEDSATGKCLLKRSPIAYGVTECDVNPEDRSQ